MVLESIAIDAIVSLGSLVVAPAFDFIRKKFIKTENDTPERTIASLAMGKPEVLPAYMSALTALKTAEIAEFNRDVVGSVSPWVSNLRASIRPIAVVGAGIYLLLLTAVVLTGSQQKLNLTPDAIDLVGGIRLSAEAIISSWFGSRISLRASGK